jgi:hypothetical protein
MRQPLLIAAALVAGACSNSDPGPIVVRTVADRTGVPVGGVQVQVEAQPWATTGADGKANFAAVPRPFTVRVHQSPRSDSHSVFVLRGRTASEVVAEVVGNPNGFSSFRRARVSGIVAGRSGSPSARVKVSVGQRNGDYGTVAAADGSFDFDALWQGDAAAKVFVRASESDGASPPGHYYGFGSASVSVVDGGETVGVPLRLEPVVEGLVSGTASLPAALATPRRVDAFLWLAFDRYQQFQLQSSPVTPESFAVVVPSVPGAEALLRIHAVGGGVQSWHQRRVAAPSSGVGFSLPAPAELLEPAAGAAVGSATVFRWSRGEPGGSSTFFLGCEWAQTGSVSYLIETEGVEATRPEIPGVAVPPGATCRWAVFWCAAAAPAMEERCAWSMERAATSL